MNKNLILIFLSAMCFALIGTALAKGNPHGGIPPGQASHPTTVKAIPFTSPPGWSKGKKTGWRGASEPPGLTKKINRIETPNWRNWWQNWLDRAR